MSSPFITLHRAGEVLNRISSLAVDISKSPGAHRNPALEGLHRLGPAEARVTRWFLELEIVVNLVLKAIVVGDHGARFIN